MKEIKELLVYRASINNVVKICSAISGFISFIIAFRVLETDRPLFSLPALIFYFSLILFIYSDRKGQKLARNIEKEL